ncbi:MAG: hypothetical protein M1816_005525 [Peltula sp. TS41687]|nr:MAG: hypothetical protein M1816_005525 [Peltula sp. TS41687]
MAETTHSNLRTLFVSAKKDRGILDSYLESSSSGYQARLKAAIASYEECQGAVDRLALFSRNESLDDLSSENLRYLLIHFYLGELISKINDLDRREVLKHAQLKYQAYLDLLDSYDILSPDDRKLHERYLDNSDLFTTASTSDPATRRAAKIARYRHEKELKQKVEYLKANQNVEYEESTVRAIHLAQTSLCTHQTFAALEAIAQELQILSLAPSHPPSHQTDRSEDDRVRRGGRRDNYSERLDPPITSLLGSGRAGPILDKGGKPLQPFTLLNRRDQLQKGVFRPGHNLPTMTIDEYLEEEKRRGGIIEGGGEQSGRRPMVDEDDMNKADEETMKAREWDEFKESNPKGSGNTLNRG